jgi:hypothetical protein
MRAVRCPFCFICLDVTRVPVGTFIKCPACSGPIRVPQPDRREPLARLLAGGAAGLIVGVLLTAAWFRLAPAGPSPAPATVRPASPVPTPPSDPSAVSPTARNLVWEELADQLSADLRAEFPGIHIQPSRPWVIALEPGEHERHAVIPLYERALHSLLLAFEEEFRELRLPEIRRPLPVLILRNRASFKSYWLRNFDDRHLPDNVPGVFHLGRGTVTYHDSHLPFERLLHEGTHQLVHAYSVNPPRTFWLHEGLGNYFETYVRVKQDGFETVQCAPSLNMPRLYDTIEGYEHEGIRPALDLSSLAGLGLTDFDLRYSRVGGADEALRRRITNSMYGVSWSLTHFMLRGGNPEYRAAFLEYLQEELRGAGGAGVFETILRRRTGRTLPELDRELKAYVSYVR